MFQGSIIDCFGRASFVLLPVDVSSFCGMCSVMAGQVRKIPVTQNLDIIPFLVDIGTIGDWNMQGLPTDPLSIQNGILVTRSSR